MKLRHISRALALVALIGSAQFTSASIQTMDRIVAVVNKSVVTQQELDSRISSIQKNMESQRITLPPAAVLKQQVLDRMILELVQVQYADQIGIRIDDSQLERAIGRMAEQNKMSLPQFREMLAKQGMSWKAFREDIRREITLTRLKEREIDNRIVISDNEIDEYIKLNTGKEQQEFRLAHILIPLPENASPEQITAKRTRALAAIEELKSGKDFASIAAVYSSAPDATSGGSLGWRAAGSLPPAFTQLLEKLNPGEITDLVRSPGGFHIVKLLEKRSQEQKTVVEQTHARHILIRTNELVSESDARQRLNQLADRLKNGSKFEELARLYSDDGSASKGGDLGWLTPGETVPEFETAMNALKQGEISPVIQSPFGLHIIQVLERRSKDMTKERERFRVRNELKQRKSEEQFEDWLRQQRDRAFVELRLKDE
ncbi:peptidylprolyl isomerase [Janthinobacterium sp. B9-8]|uniref:peptidylprolyl isomerase n=1 Tax=Janthinobacterium sp. B9-8 TaxID=1236179 RepID=UPI00061CE03F|nr:peptidylprolyl isomerase [Janthinobacterium sp. B9-8]AMC36656.1 molecular chaperone SurA [Janthinobacterium sp. B9-8]